MMQKDQKYQSKFINLLTDLFLNSILNPYLHMILNLLQYLIVFGILLQQEIFNMKRIKQFDNSFITTLVLLILVLQCIFLGMIGFLLISQKNQKKENVFIMQYEGYITQKVKQIVALFLIVYRKILSLIILQLSFWILESQNQVVSIQWFGTIGNLALFTPIYLISGIIFASKIAFLPNVVSFGYKINLQTLIFVYLPLMVGINQLGQKFTAFMNILFIISGIATLYIRPLVLYRHNTIGLVGVGMILGLMTVWSCQNVFDIETKTHQDYLLFIVSCLVIAWIIVKYSQRRINFILLCKVQNTLLNKLNNWNKDEIIFYHLVNYQTQRNSIFLYLVQELQTLRQKKVTQKQGSQKNILYYQTDNANKQSILLVSKIIQSLKQTSFKDPSLRKLLDQFIFLKYKSLYNPKLLLELNLGKKQLKQKIAHRQNLSMIIVQILLFDQINLRKCYTFMKIHQSLLAKIDQLSFISKIQIHSLIRIVENNLKFKTTTQKEYNLKAQQYFIFQQRYEQLKNQIIKACQLKIHFWRQNLHQDPNCHTIHRNLKENYTIYTKIQTLTQQITQQFKHKGPIILYDLIASYTTKILNIKMFSSLNPFYSLIKKYKQQIANEKKQGSLLQHSSIKKYSLLQNIGVCQVDLQTEKGKILWANQYFWTQFYLQNFKDLKEHNEDRKENFVFDVMIPQLRFRHKTYFKLFTQSQKLNHQHDLSFVFQSDTKIIDRVSAEIQVFPSFKNGFNASVFLLKNQQKQTDCQKFAVLVKDDMSIVGYTEEFLKEKSYLAQGEYKTVEIDSENREFLCEQLTTYDVFHDFLQDYRSGNTKVKSEIQVSISDLEYQVKMLKIYPLNENVTAKVFAQEQSTMDQKFFTGQQQIQSCIYLLQFQKKNNGSSTDLNDEKSIFKSGTTYQQVLMGNISDIRTHASLFTSINSNNIDKALKKESQIQKNKVQEKETQKIQDETQSIQKKYKRVMFKKGSRATYFWVVFTIIVVFLLAAAILANLVIFQTREQLYETKKLTIKYFNQLITDICQLCIALRQYNYFANVNGPHDPRIPLLIDQVKNQESQVGFKLNYLSGYMNEKWMALEILKTGSFNFVSEEQYVVIANYMLSSMTYLSQINPQQMTFSPFFAQYIGKPLTSAQVNFNQAIFNGIFVVLTNLSSLRPQFLSIILENITDTRDQIYIYPCSIGLIILLIFMIVSISIQKRSQNLRGDALCLLAQVPDRLIKEKIDSLLQFKQKNCFILATHLSSSIEDEKSLSSQKIFSNPMKNLLKEGNKFSRKLSQNPDLNEKGSETENDTKRDLVDMEEIYNIQKPQISIQNSKSKAFSANEQIQDERFKRKSVVKLPVTRMQRYRFLFYLLVIGPSLSYFLVMLLSGFNIDSYMSLSFEMGSEIHNKKTNQQLSFLLTREAFYFQKFKVLGNLNWKNVVMNEISDTLVHDRMLQKLIDENEQAVNLRKLMQRISHGNLCDLINQFNGSVYYDVTFSRQQCESIDSGLLKQGLKPTENQFLQTGIEIINSIPDPITLTIPQRYKYLKMPELKTMKILLAYLQQVMDIMDNTLQIDLDNEIYAYTQKTQLYSSISIAALVIILFALRYRWTIINRHKKEIISILEIISLQSIKTHSNLNEKFNQMPLKFHN